MTKIAFFITVDNFPFIQALKLRVYNFLKHDKFNAAQHAWHIFGKPYRKFYTMKKLLVLFGLSLALFAFAPRQEADDIVKALQTANADNIASYFDQMIDMKLPDNVNEIKNINKTQAGIKLKSFFNENDVKGFDLTSKREMGGLMAITGKLNAGKTGYNITLMLKDKGGKFSIITVRVN